MANLLSFVKRYWYVILPLPLMVIVWFITKKAKTMSTTSTTPKPTEIKFSERNNPFNIRPSKDVWQGSVGVATSSKSGVFVAFKDLLHGVRAGIITMRTYFNVHHKNTIRKIITAYAPSVENDTNHYIDFVSKQTGFKPDQILTYDQRTVNALLKAISIQEGAHKVTDDELEQAWQIV